MKDDDAEYADYWTVIYGKRSFSRSERDEIYKRDKGICKYCGKKISRKKAEFDHVHPWSKGGPTIVENGATACRPCNRRKHAKSDKPYDAAGIFFRNVHILHGCEDRNMSMNDYYSKTRWLTRFLMLKVRDLYT